ncbi:helix-turn-helix domain-containing protein [Bogoriella caseilytica]|uniref:Regulatory LuxR family protein n=1 Tax=Bogoriella caseilytica TaxID=56055 RepID=A0A3N2BDX1_9MICO|nr:helix-turn-helix transcriptional regulator [Bogoriella caseilytica]ROR73234.1 regulatory LuxR family protein [Bogoriella caseilytica]
MHTVDEQGDVGPAEQCRALIAEAHDAWLRGDGAGTWRALDAAERAAAHTTRPSRLRAEVAAARSAAFLRAERTTEALAAARECLHLAGRATHGHRLRHAVSHARITLATYEPPDDGSGQAPAAALAVLDEIAELRDPGLEDVRSRAITNGLNRRLVAAHRHLDDPEAQTAAWIQVSRARTLSEQLRAQGSVVRQAIDLAERTGQWERGWDYANLPLPSGLERNERVAILAKAARLAWHRGLTSEARELGTRARQASVAIDHPWVRVYAYLGGVIAAAAGTGSIRAALLAYQRCTTRAGHDSRSHRAWEVAQVALEFGLSANAARSFLAATVPGVWAERPWAPFARVVLSDAAGEEPRTEDLAAIDLREHGAADQARVHLARARVAARSGHRVSAVLSLQRARLLLRSWPGRVAEQVEREAATLTGTLPATAAQRRVLDLVIEGHTNREIGRALGCAERTVAVHVAALLRSSSTTSRAALAAQEVARRALMVAPEL